MKPEQKKLIKVLNFSSDPALKAASNGATASDSITQKLVIANVVALSMSIGFVIFLTIVNGRVCNTNLITQTQSLANTILISIKNQYLALEHFVSNHQVLCWLTSSVLRKEYNKYKRHINL